MLETLLRGFSMSDFFFYRVLQPANLLSFPWKPLWKPKMHTKASFFLWTTVLGKILTIDNL